MTTHSVDLLIVGAGPVGLYGAYYAGVRGLRAAVIDSLSEVGGQVSALYPEKMIFDVAGFPAIKGRDLVAALAKQAAPAKPLYLLGQEAQELGTDENGRHHVTTSGGDEIDCGAIVVTAGIGTFTPRKLPAGEEFLGRGLEYFVPDPLPYAGSDVVIVGGGDSALDWALMLEPIASSVRGRRHHRVRRQDTPHRRRLRRGRHGRQQCGSVHQPGCSAVSGALDRRSASADNIGTGMTQHSDAFEGRKRCRT